MKNEKEEMCNTTLRDAKIAIACRRMGVIGVYKEDAPWAGKNCVLVQVTEDTARCGRGEIVVVHMGKEMKQSASALPANDIYASQILCADIGAAILAYTEKHKHMSYKMGARSTAEGCIDCSGWVAELVPAVMAQINASYATPLYDINKLSQFLKAAAAPQVERTGQQTGLIAEQDIYAANMQSGTLIGLRTRTGGEWAADRWNQISHIVVFFKVGDVAFVSQSESGKGVCVTLYDQWVRRQMGAQNTLFACNPFDLVAENLDPSILLRPSDSSESVNTTNSHLPSQSPISSIRARESLPFLKM